MDWAAACVLVIYRWSGWPGPAPGRGCQGPALDNPPYLCCGVRGRGQGGGGGGFYLPGGGQLVAALLDTHSALDDTYNN